MKTALIQFFLMIIILNASGKEWDLFPFNQCSYFEVSSGDGKKNIEEISNDSMFFDSVKEWFFFNSKFDNKKCYGEYEYWIKRHTNPGFDVEGSCWLSDTVFYYCTDEYGNERVFKFYPNAKQNDQWNIDLTDFVIKCDSTGILSIFGEPDSVKFFSVYTNGTQTQQYSFSLILSKNLGLIEFVPFNQIFFDKPENFSSFKLIGFEKDTISIGALTPDFDDIFHLSLGDVFIWEQYFHRCAICHPDVYEPAKTYFLKDSLVHIENTADTLIYEFVRLTESGISSALIRKFNKTEYQNLFKSYSSNGYFFPDVPFAEYSFYDEMPSSFFYRSGLAFSDDTILISFYSPGYVLDTINCGLAIPEVDFKFGFNNYFGLTSYAYGDPSTTVIETLIGANVSGVEWGKKWEKVGLNELKLISLQIYPNPVNDFIFIKNTLHSRLKFQITDLGGNIILKGQLLNTAIDVKALSPGIYLLHVFNEDTQYRTKFYRTLN
jgi:hypothetical protein